MIEWDTVLVLGMAAVFAVLNYLTLSRARTPMVPGGTAHVAIEAMERALASQAGRIDAQSRRIDELEAAMDAQQANHRAEMGVLREELEEAYRGLGLLIEQIQTGGMTPVWLPAPRKKTGGGGGVAGGPEKDWLVGRIVEGFSKEELDNLAFDVGINGENLVGESLETRARELVKAAGRLGKRGDLERLVNELRPRL